MLSPLYGQLSPLRIPTKAGRIVQDTDALAYIAAVETADAQTLEDGVKFAFEDFIVGCKADGTWASLTASCILAGARTLSGALVPLVGPAPINNNFVSDDYNRITGLASDGSTKRLTSLNNNSLGQNNSHFYIRITDEDSRTVTAGIMGTLASQTGSSAMRRNSSTALQFWSMSASAASISGTNVVFRKGCGVVRASSSQCRRFENGILFSANNIASSTPRNEAIYILAAGSSYTTSRAAFFSIGANVNLTLLDSRVSTLINDLAAAI